MKLVAAALALLLLACGPKTTPEDPLPADPPGAAAGTGAAIDPEVEAKAIAAFELLEALATAAEAGAGDCAQIAAGMQAVADGAGGNAIRDADADERMTPAAAEALFARHGARYDQAAARLERALQPCPDAPAIDAVFQQIGLMAAAPPAGASPSPAGDD